MATTIRIMKWLVLAAVVFTGITAYSYSNTPSQYELLQKELARYQEIESRGGWSRIKAPKKFYQMGESTPAIPQIKSRLRTVGDFTSADTSRVFTQELVEAVKKAQRRFGFRENGVVDAPLIRELNVPVSKRIAQLRVNMERLHTLPASVSGPHLVANIPEFKLHIYEDDRHVFDMDIVVGTEANQTVIFNDELQQIVFSPCWNVPPTIVKNEILPAMKRDHDYLWRNGYVQTGTEDGLPVLKQLPGPQNALGGVKFLFPNSHNIYFHDTPAKSLFAARKRTFSHGCIRLAEPAKLAEYLLRNSPEWTPAKITQAMNASKEQWVKLENPVPVSITYFTAWIDHEGILHFREDIYGHDQ